MKKKVFTFLLLSLTAVSFSQVRLPKLISDGMILQRNTKLKIWGWASSGEPVTIFFKGKKYNTTADEQGNWFAMLPEQKAGGPFTLTISASNKIVLNDILIGDVWLCSGQSNMEQAMSGRLKYKYADEIASANNNFIRQFLVPDKYNFNHAETDVETGAWKPATPQNIGEFTAIGYFFAKELYAKYQVPIGIINAALGGSPAEAWISETALLKNFPEYYHEMQKFKDEKTITDIERKQQIESDKWISNVNNADNGIKNNWRNPALDDKDWSSIQVPASLSDKSDNNSITPVYWFRKKILVPASMVKQPAKLELGRIVEADSVFINGTFIGTTSYQYPPRRYEIPSGVLKEGENVIAVRILKKAADGGFVPDKRYELTSVTDTIPLSGEWKFHPGGFTVDPAPATTFIRWKPGGLHNAMIAPLTNFSIKGVLWYQGETNANYPANYRQLMQTLIEDWRRLWQKGNFPFIYVQLPNFLQASSLPQLNSNWAAMRQLQLQTLSVPNTGMAVTIDLGEWNDIHPENKKDAGYRLSLLARKISYGEKKLVASGPLYQSMKVDENKIIISFSNTGSGLVFKNGQPDHFFIAGKDNRYKKANVAIRQNKLVVWSDEVQQPVAVKYAWADNPEGCNLYNKEGLPASPFTTDNWKQ